MYVIQHIFKKQYLSSALTLAKVKTRRIETYFDECVKRFLLLWLQVELEVEEIARKLNAAKMEVEEQHG